MWGHHIYIAAAGAAVAGVIASLANNGHLHKAAVAITTKAMEASDAVAAETQSIVDEANDKRAEDRLQKKIDSAVKEEIDKIAPDIRAKVIAKINEEGA